MYFSPATVIAVAGVLASPLVAQAAPANDNTISARPIEARTFGLLWTQKSYGASGVPWDRNSAPGAWCGGNKPSTNWQWRNLPKWDGGDFSRCSTWTWSWWGWITGQNTLKVCKNANKGYLPRGCNPPHSGGGSTTPVSSVPASVPSASANATVSSAAAPSAAPSLGPDPNPTQNPVCQGNYQAQYLDYKIVAPNGYWMGQTVGSATQDGSYMTYTLSDTVDNCLKACNQIEGCVFVNTYYDTNDEENYLPKHAPGVLTCAMFSTCVSSTKNDNFGGQDDPNQIYQSNGYCKSGACGV